ncbi:MAG: energy-coupling factor ABC transporter substrate-binding protein [Vallitaleaceae bacterium]|nr:energy-coupling factor ABC transporter substrate-binding protein [Vallitaleaceae bacterium]
MAIYLILITLVIALIVLPLLLVKEGAFTGSDGLAQDAILEDHPDYKPWFTSFFKPPSAEIESLLFAIQASLGTGIVCYCLGYWRGLKKKKEEKSL